MIKRFRKRHDPKFRINYLEAEVRELRRQLDFLEAHPGFRRCLRKGGTWHHPDNASCNCRRPIPEAPDDPGEIETEATGGLGVWGTIFVLALPIGLLLFAAWSVR